MTWKKPAGTPTLAKSDWRSMPNQTTNTLSEEGRTVEEIREWVKDRRDSEYRNRPAPELSNTVGGGMSLGAVVSIPALLSDPAIKAGAQVMFNGPGERDMDEIRSVVQAALETAINSEPVETQVADGWPEITMGRCKQWGMEYIDTASTRREFECEDGVEFQRYVPAKGTTRRCSCSCHHLASQPEQGKEGTP